MMKRSNSSRKKRKKLVKMSTANFKSIIKVSPNFTRRFKSWKVKNSCRLFRSWIWYSSLRLMRLKTQMLRRSSCWLEVWSWCSTWTSWRTMAGNRLRLLYWRILMTCLKNRVSWSWWSIWHRCPTEVFSFMWWDSNIWSRKRLSLKVWIWKILNNMLKLLICFIELIKWRLRWIRYKRKSSLMSLLIRLWILCHRCWNGPCSQRSR